MHTHTHKNLLPATVCILRRRRVQVLGRWQRAVLQHVAALTSQQALADPVAELEARIAQNQVNYPEGTCKEVHCCVQDQACVSHPDGAWRPQKGARRGCRRFCAGPGPCVCPSLRS